jgi:eukaryotic-like serine/threonine-protein kinase
VNDTGEQPTFFGKYEVLSPIGKGGMAVVHRACIRGPAGASRPVALKVIHPSLSEEQLFVDMFHTEVRVALALNHRNIVQTFDAGVEQGRYYMGMELISGCSLHELLFRRVKAGLPLDIALFITVELCSALSYAHDFSPELAGQPGAVVHCDVSPSNILLGREGVVKLADFGVARAKDRLHQTSLDLVKGKLNYMPPEQAHGRAESRSDIFSTGVVLWEMLAGKRLRHLANLADVLEGPREIPSLRGERPEIPAALEAIIEACLATDPDDRPESAEALRRMLAEELFRVQLKEHSGGDTHERLGAYLEQVLAETPAPASVRAGAGGLAQALAAEALALSVATDAAEPSTNTNTNTNTALTVPQRPAVREPKLTAPTTAEPLRPAAESRAAATILDRARRTAPEKRLTAPTTVEPVRPGNPAQAVEGEISGTDVLADQSPAGSGSVWPKLALFLLMLGLGSAGVWAAKAFLVGSGGSGNGDSGGQVDAAGAAPDAVPIAKKPAVTKPAVRKPAVRKPAVRKPAVRKPAVRKPAARKPAARKPAVRKPATRKPAARKPARRGTGTLDLNALPWAKVYLGSRYLGDTPLQALKLPAGRHTLRLTNPERNLTKTVRVTIRAGGTVSRVVRLTGP